MNSKEFIDAWNRSATERERFNAFVTWIRDVNSAQQGIEHLDIVTSDELSEDDPLAVMTIAGEGNQLPVKVWDGLFMKSNTVGLCQAVGRAIIDISLTQAQAAVRAATYKTNSRLPKGYWH
jgi:hypothetical protein